MTEVQPGAFRIARALTIQASPEALFALVDDFRAWTQWSPWEKLDADLQRTYAGPNAGRGAVYAWEGRKAGTGRMEILQSRPGRRIVIQLVFLKPMKATNLAEFTFEPDGDATRVTWSMSGRHTMVTRLMHSVLGLDKMVGKDFEAGLASLKSIADRAHAPA